MGNKTGFKIGDISELCYLGALSSTPTEKPLAEALEIPLSQKRVAWGKNFAK